MSQTYSRSLMRIAVAQICQNLGWNSAVSSSLELLTDVSERYILKLGTICHNYSEHCGRTEPNLNDLALAFQQVGINLDELEDYVRHVDPVPFAHEVVAFPASKKSNLGIPNPRSREILHHREEHIDDHLPHMFPDMKNEVPDENAASPGVGNDLDVKEGGDNETKTLAADVIQGDKWTKSSPDGPPSKRQRMANSNLPEEASHSQYEMTSVFMGPNGVLTTRQGYLGRRPEPRLPPPNPYNIPEGKENSGKSKDSSGGSGPKISISVGGVSVDGSSDSKGKSSKKSKDGKKEFKKGSLSSKSASRYLDKLKKSKKSFKLFEKGKHNDGDKGKKHNIHKVNGKESRKKKQQFKSAAIIDSDEELRNLCSPSTSREPSPDHDTNVDSEGKRARMDAIDDSINAVLREDPGKPGRPKKRKKEPDNVEKGPLHKKEGDAKIKKVKKKPGRKPKDKAPENVIPPHVDVKPFVSERYSTEELQVYEFNDSPPDASSKVKKQCPGASSPYPITATTSLQKAMDCDRKSEPMTTRPLKAAKYKKQPEEELFAPEIKIESRKKEVKKNKQQTQKKEETKYQEKKGQDSREEKDDSKSKEYKKDRKDRKKREEKKKKKHKEKEKDKKREDKLKHESSRESSPAVGGVRLTIKIGGSTGGSSSMTVTADSPAASPALSTTSSMSLPRSIPKLYISKKGSEEKAKKPSKGSEGSSGATKSKSSPVAISSKSNTPSPTPHSRESSTTAPRKTSTPSPTPSSHHSDKKSPSPHSSKMDSHKKKSPSNSSSKERQGRTMAKRADKRRKEKKVSLSPLSSSSSSPSKSSPVRNLTPPRLRRMSSSTEKSPPPVPAQSPSRSPKPALKKRSRSPSSLSRSLTPPPPLSSNKATPPPSLSPPPAGSRHNQHPHSPSPSKPPTPGSTSPTASPEWNLPVSPMPHRSPTPTPRTPTGSPTHPPPSPSQSSPPASPSRREPSPVPSVTKSSLSKSSTVVAETVCVFFDEKGQKVWICPACKLQDDGSEMIGCDQCDNWYHWPCVNIKEAPPEDEQWFCPSCVVKTKPPSRGRGGPRGRGRGRGRKKNT